MRGATGALPAFGGARDPGAQTRVVLGILVTIVAASTAVYAGPKGLLLPVALVGVGIGLRFPPLLLAAFVFVPFFESAPLIRLLPGSPSALFGALLIAVCAWRLTTRSVAALPAGLVIPFLIIGIALAVGLLGTPAPGYGSAKVIKYFTETLLAAGAPFFVLRTRTELMQFLGAIAVGGVIIALVTPFVAPTVIPGVTYELDTQGRFSFGGQIFPARFLGTAALVLLAIPAFARTRARFVCPLIAAGVLFVALGFGARGPIAAFLAALTAVVLLSGLHSPRQLVLVLLAVTVAGVVLPFVNLPGQSAERLTQAVANPAAVLQGDTRSALYDQALRLTETHPLTGIGTGGFSIYTLVITPPKFKLNYPHNILLELSAEVGVIPVIVLMVPVVAGMGVLLRRVRMTQDRSDRNIAILVMGLFLLNFFAAQFSGDINDNRTLWLFLSLAWLIGRDGLRSEPSGPPAAT